MSSAGYSGTPLARKLGIREDDRLAIVGDPGHAVELLEPLPAARRGRPRLCRRPRSSSSSRPSGPSSPRSIGALGEAIFPDGACWIAWPKRASKVETDMTEDVVRELALPLGLVDTKVCAVDETWSGLKLVWRKELRAGRGPAPTRTA